MVQTIQIKTCQKVQVIEKITCVQVQISSEFYCVQVRIITSMLIEKGSYQLNKLYPIDVKKVRQNDGFIILLLSPVTECLIHEYLVPSYVV